MINKESATKNITELDNIFRRNGVKYWLQDGTLLGYYRENDFIGHDNDVDIGIEWRDFNRSTMNDIINAGFVLRASSGLVNDSLVINVIKRDVSVDLYFYYQINKEYFYHTAVVKKPITNGRYRIDFTYKVFGVKEIDFLGGRFFVPEDELYFIKTKYGQTWQTPDTEWVSSVSPKNRTLTDISVSKKKSRNEFMEWLSNGQ
jgi:hypothetical protein